MKLSKRALRILGASFIALLSIGAAFGFSTPGLLSGRIATAESTRELLAAYAAKDTDSDGVPDWQEALYGTDPTKVDSDDDGINDAEAVRQGLVKPSALASQLPSALATTTPFDVSEIPGVDAAPGSITERFSQEFFQRFVEASNGEPMDEQTRQQLAVTLIEEFARDSASAVSSRYQLISVRTSPSATLASYAEGVERALQVNDIPGEGGRPYALMQGLIEQNSESARSNLAAVSAAYRAITDDLLIIPVPPAMAERHLALVKSFDTLAKSTEIIVGYERDPLGTLAALRAFQDGSSELSIAITAIATEIVRVGTPADGAPGSLLLRIARTRQAL